MIFSFKPDFQCCQIELQMPTECRSTSAPLHQKGLIVAFYLKGFRGTELDCIRKFPDATN